MTHVYTDGSCHKGVGGWAFVIPELDYECFGKTEDTTNNRMELTALLEALTFLEDKVENVTIFTDSQYVIGGATRDHNSVSNLDLLELVHEKISKFHSVTFKWVKGHSKNEFNSRADELARYDYSEDRDTS